MPSRLTARVDRLYRRRGERCPHCGKFPGDPPSPPAERAPSHEIDPQAFADFMRAVQQCGVQIPDLEEGQSNGR
jgi:hypothetical protein